jgi:COMPASS component SPP1
MAFKLSELLNPAPNSDPPSPTFHEKLPSPSQQAHFSALDGQTTPHHSRHNSYNGYPPASANRDVVDTYPQLSPCLGNPRRENSGSELDYAPQQQSHSRGHSRNYSGSPILTNYGPPATPVEPSPPQSTRPPFSPTLDQYHHTSHSPVTDTKPSWASRRTASPPPILAPIQVHSMVSNEQSAQKAPPMKELDYHLHQADQKPLTSSVNTQPVISGDEMEDVRYEVKGQESAITQNTTLHPQLQQASPNPLLPTQDETIQSPMLRIKTEASATPREATPIPPIVQASPRGDPSASPATDALSPKAVPDSAHGREESIMNPPSTGASTPTRDTPLRGTPFRSTPASKSTGKKPAAAKSTAAKRGTVSAVKKPQKKKRKLDSDSFDEPQSSRSSAAPASSRASKTPAVNARKQSSTPVPAQASSSPAPEDYEEGAELYCICRRPDSHTWMIGCDGGCEDWFHGACVNIKQDDGDLIDKYICMSIQYPQVLVFHAVD